MIGAIIGDVVGSRFEFQNYLRKDFQFYGKGCCYTDDTVMTCAVAYVLLECKGDWSKLTHDFIAKNMQYVGRRYPNCGYGAKFIKWMFDRKPEPYNSCGNGSAMRISPVGWVANSVDEVKEISKKITQVSHDHPEGLKGAEATAVAIYLARKGYTKEEIKKYVEDNYYKMDMTCDDYAKLLAGEHGKEICQISVPQAFECFFESVDYEDAIRNAVSTGGDSDTVGAICGAIAEAFYGIPDYIVDSVDKYLPELLAWIKDKFVNKYMTKDGKCISVIDSSNDDFMDEYKRLQSLKSGNARTYESKA